MNNMHEPRLLGTLAARLYFAIMTSTKWRMCSDGPWLQRSTGAS